MVGLFVVNDDGAVNVDDPDPESSNLVAPLTPALIVVEPDRVGAVSDALPTVAVTSTLPVVAVIVAPL